MVIVSTLLGGTLGFVGFMISYFALRFSFFSSFGLYFGIALTVFALLMAIAAIPARASKTASRTV